MDLAFVEPNANNLWVLLQTNNKHFGSSKTLLVYNGSKPSILAGDFNNESQFDIAVANSGIDNIGILIGHGDGTFESMITYPMRDGTCCSEL